MAGAAQVARSRGPRGRCGCVAAAFRRRRGRGRRGQGAQAARAAGAAWAALAAAADTFKLNVLICDQREYLKLETWHVAIVTWERTVPARYGGACDGSVIYAVHTRKSG